MSIFRLGLFLFTLIALVSMSWAQDEDTPTPTATPLPTPVAVSLGAKLNDGDHRLLPRAPKIGPTGKVIRVDVDDHIYRGAYLDKLADPTSFALIDGFNKSETKSQQDNWHEIQGSSFCHLREGDNDWYGFRTGPDFHWVLSHGGRIWFHDRFADRWLFYDQGNWWWQGNDKKNPVQVFLKDNHYYACDAHGVLGNNLGTMGTEEVITKPIVKDTPVSAKDENPANAGMGGMGSGMGMKSY